MQLQRLAVRIVPPEPGALTTYNRYCPINAQP